MTARRKADRLVRRIDGLLRVMRKEGIEEVVVSGMVIRAEDDLIVVETGTIRKFCTRPVDVAETIREILRKRTEDGRTYR